MKRITLFVVVSLVMSITAFAGDTDEDCDMYAVMGTTRQLGLNVPFVGTLTFVNVMTNEPVEVETTAVLLGLTAIDAEGMHAVTSHDLNGGPIVNVSTFDKATITPAGGLISELTVAKGEKAYSCGKVIFGLDPMTGAPASTITLYDPTTNTPGEANFSGFAKLCDCGK